MKTRQLLVIALLILAAIALAAFLISLFVVQYLPSQSRWVPIFFFAVLVAVVTFLNSLTGYLKNFIDLLPKILGRGKPNEAASQEGELANPSTPATKPNIKVEFSHRLVSSNAEEHQYQLNVMMKNQTDRTINRFQLEFTFPDIGMVTGQRTWSQRRGHIVFSKDPNGNLKVVHHSQGPLYPDAPADVGSEIHYKYKVNRQIRERIRESISTRELALDWILYVDDMSPIKDTIPLSTLHVF